MKKALLTLSIITAVAMNAQGAHAFDWGCNKCEKQTGPACPVASPCATPCEETKPCEDCFEKAQSCGGDCMTRKTEEFYCRLGLDDCQKEQARKIKDDHECALKPLRDQIKSDRDCLCEAITAPCLDKKVVRERERQLRADKRAFMKEMKSLDKEFKTILVCKQKSEYRKLKRELKYRTKKGMKYCCKICKD